MTERAKLVEEIARWQKAERNLSDAYVRLRAMIPGAFDTPHAPTAQQIWCTTEQALRAVLAHPEAGSLRALIVEVIKAGNGDIRRDPSPAAILAETGWYDRAKEAVGMIPPDAHPEAGSAGEVERLEAECPSKSEQIGKLYRVCNERTVLRDALQNLCEAWDGKNDGGKYRGNVTNAYNAAQIALSPSPASPEGGA